MVVRPYIVKSSAEKMPRGCWHPYRRVAVIETHDGYQPAMISSRARGVVHIVAEWRRRNVGKKIKSAYIQAMDEAIALARRLNSEAWGCPI